MRTQSIVILAVLLATGGQTRNTTTPGRAASATDDGRYAATIRRTSFGIPHITAANVGSLGFGEGYAFAEDHLCSLADQVVRARGERAKFFGAGEKDVHLQSDIAMKALRVAELGAASVQQAPPEIQDWQRGYAAGYNSYLATVGVDGVAGWCRGAPWVRPLSVEDVAARARLVTLTLPAFAGPIATAAPPAGGSGPAETNLPDPEASLSNGWAIGKDRSETGRGMLLANPHYPWVGANRFWEKHLTIPGALDVYGVSLLGSPGVAIGFNKDVAWTHTVSAGARFTAYALTLVPGQPTVYLYDGQPRPMTAREIVVDVRQPDGNLRTVSHTVYFSHHGPVVNYPGLPWTARRAIALRDANADNDEATRAWWAINRASSLDDLKRAHARPGGIPFVNTIAAAADGRTLYIDGASAPLLSKETIAWWRSKVEQDGDVKTAYARGTILLDGSDSRFEWVRDDRARDPGIVPGELVPQIERTDYVFNANDSHWLANPRALLTGYSPVHGLEGTWRTLRTRMNARVLDDGSRGGPAGDNGRFSLEELTAAAFSNRSMSAELLRTPLVSQCQASASVQIDGSAVDVSKACQTLAAWDGKLNLDSRGAVLWREFITQYRGADFGRAGRLFATDFDPADPVGTPRDLATATGSSTDSPLVSLARAVRVLERASLAVDAPLGGVQFAARGSHRIPLHGGLGGEEGVINFVNYGPNDTTLEPDPAVGGIIAGSRYLTRDGYPVNRGSSFVMALAFTARGPVARAVLTYGESGDPRSPHFSDQTELFSKKAWRDILFTEDQIRKDPNLRARQLSEPIPKR